MSQSNSQWAGIVSQLYAISLTEYNTYAYFSAQFVVYLLSLCRLRYVSVPYERIHA